MSPCRNQSAISFNLNTDKINIVLILIAACVACILPIETFLFSYAVLGPLHYITELNWLHEKSYFTHRKAIIWIFIVIAALLTLITLVMEYSSEWWLFMNIEQRFPILIFVALIFSILPLIPSRDNRYFFAGISAILYALMDIFQWSYLLLAILLPTIIHVYFFTGNFMLLGALKAKSKWSYLSFFVFMIANVIVLLAPTNIAITNGNTEQLLATINFKYLIEWLSGEAFQGDLLQHKNTIIAVRFLAFAYSYHYLNWFSKTNVIGWMKVAKPKLLLALGVWISAVAVYAYDYKTGFFVLFFLSMLHVIAEFPLNYITLKNTIVALRNFKV